MVYDQLMAFPEEHNILEVFQSGFKTLHSTESAILKVFNDIFQPADSGDCVVLVLAPAFATVDHKILLSHLAQWVGIRDWFRYLENRTFCVSLGGHVSSSAALSCGMPQGSVLGPFSLPYICFHLAPYWGNMVCSSTVMLMIVRRIALSKRKMETVRIRC